MENTPPTPQVVSRKKRIFLVAAVIIVIIIILTIIAGFFFLLRGTSQTPANPTNLPLPANQITASESPEAANTSTPTAVESPTATPLLQSQAPSPSSPPTYPPDAQASLIVKINYTFQPSFSVKIDSLRRSYEIPTIDLLQPADDEPYSLVVLRSSAGEVINQYKFSVTSQIMYDDFSGSVPSSSPQDIISGTEVYVIPVNTSAVPAKISLESPTGHVFDQTDIDYGNLPEDTPPPKTGWLQKLLKPFLSFAEAQDSDNQFTLVVINDTNAISVVDGIHNRTQTMTTSIAPWTELGDKMNLIKVTNYTDDLECGSATVTSGSTLPSCPPGIALRAASVAAGVRPNAVVAIAGANCNCGSTRLNSTVSTVGMGVNTGVITHELGHALRPSLQDEYLGDRGVTNQPNGPNCFDTEDACLSAIAPYPDSTVAACSLGCSRTNNYRPASQIMYRAVPPFGPVEENIVRQQLNLSLGQTQPPGGPGTGGDTFWGWHR
ncbi:MAG: hypothetical protein Q8P73_05005 [bacterium]|nr:hypothetical protein [bacterium]MDZ4347778.1 hypothetical protein [Candidatus Binatia bacterium]